MLLVADCSKCPGSFMTVLVRNYAKQQPRYSVVVACAKQFPAYSEEVSGVSQLHEMGLRRATETMN